MPKDRNPDNAWSEDPPSTAYEDRVTLVRAPQTGNLRVVCLSEKLTGRDTHYWNGRTMPCPGEGCPACAANMRPRWSGYIAALNIRTDNLHIVELTMTNAAILKEARVQHGTLHGLQLEIYRISATANGRVQIKQCGRHKAPHQLPQCPNVIDVMMRIWGFKKAIVLPEDDPENNHLSEAEVLQLPARLKWTADTNSNAKANGS